MCTKSSRKKSPIVTNSSGRLGRLCIKKYYVTPDRIGSIADNCFRWRAIRLINSLPKSVRNITDVDISVFKRSPDYFLRTLRDSPTEPFSDNSVNRRIEEASQLMLWRASDADLVR